MGECRNSAGSRILGGVKQGVEYNRRNSVVVREVQLKVWAIRKLNKVD